MIRSISQRIKDNDSGDCGQCGGRGFITCTWCSGSKKSISNRFGRTTVSLKACRFDFNIDV